MTSNENESSPSYRFEHRTLLRFLVVFVLLTLISIAAVAAGTGGVAAQGGCDVTVSDGDDIQQALDAASTGDVVCVESGEYEQSLEIRTDVTLKAADGATPVLDGSDADDIGIFVNATSGVTVEGFEVRNYGFTGVYVVDSSGVTLRENTATGNDGPGFFVENAPGVTMRENVASENGDEADFGNVGFQVKNADNAVIEGNLADENEHYGYYLVNSDGMEIRENTAESNGNWGFGIGRDAGNDPRIDTPVVENNTALNHTGNQGFVVEGSIAPSIVENHADGNLRGIEITYAEDAEVRNNDLMDSVLGIYVRETEGSVDGLLIESNTVSETSRSIQVDGADGVEIRDNELGDLGKIRPVGELSAGVRLRHGANEAFIHNNTITNTHRGIELADDHDDVVIEHNTISELTNVAGVSTSGGIVLGDSFDSTEPHGVFDPVVRHNELTEISGRAIWTSRVSGLNATNNTVTDSGTGFLLSGGNTDSVVADNVVTNSSLAVSRVGNDSMVRNNDFSANTRGILLEATSGADNATFAGNNVSHTDEYGLQFNSIGDVDQSIFFEENEFTHSGGDGVRVQSVFGVELSNNTISHNDGYGVVTRDDIVGNDLRPDTVIIDNEIADNRIGVQLEDAEGAVLSGNTVTANDESGVRLDASQGAATVANVTVEHNTVADNGEHGIALRSFGGDAPEYAEIRHNEITDNADDGIVMNDLLRSNDPVVVEPTVSNNTVTGHSVDVRLSRTVDATVSENTFETGLYIQSPPAHLEDRPPEHFVHDIADNVFEDGSPLYYVEGADDPDVPVDAGQVFVVGSSDVTLDGEYGIDGAPVGVFIADSDGAELQGATVADTEEAVRILNADDVVLDDVELRDNEEILFIDESDGLVLRESELSGNEAGLVLSDGSGFEVVDNEIVDNNVTGFENTVWLTDAPDAVVESNTISGPVEADDPNDGISVGDSDGVEVRDNTVSGVDTAVTVGGSLDAVVAGNDLSDSEEGIVVVSDGLVVENNTLTDIETDGIRLPSEFTTSTGPTDVTIEHNTITRIGEAGVLDDRGEGTVIAHNTISEADSGIEFVGTLFRADGDPSATVHNNTILDNVEGVTVDIDAPEIQLVDNDIQGNTEFGVNYAETSPISDLDARNNWWGDASGPSSEFSVEDPETGTVADGNGDRVSANVLFDPWDEGEDMEPGALDGTVTEAGTGDGIEDVGVAVIGEGGVVGGDNTASDGTFEVGDLDPGSYDVNFAADGYEDQRLESVVIEDGETTTLDVELASVGQGTLTGTVTDEDTGDSVEGVSVDVYDADDDRVTGGETDAQGDYEFELEPGTYRVILNGVSLGYELADIEDVEITADETTVVDVALVPEDDPDPEPALSVTDVSVNETELSAGDTVAVNATVENTGDAAGTLTADLEIDGTAVANASVDVEPGETETVEFTYTFDTAGDFVVSIDGVEAEAITVEAEADDEDDDPFLDEPEDQPGFGFGVAVLALVAVTLLVQRRR